MRNVLWAAVATTLGVLLSLVGNLATNTVVLTAGWRVGLWVAAGVLGAGTIALAVRQNRADRSCQLSDDVLTTASASRVTNGVRDVHAPTVQAGRIDKVELHYTQVAPISTRHLVGVVPPRADGFQQRAVMIDVAGAWSSGSVSASAGSGATVLSGLGGVGKTQIAAEYARSLWASDSVDVLVWTEAMSREAVVSGYTAAAAEITGATEADSERSVSRLLAWLAGTSRRWLVVLDDLQSPADLRGLWPPNTPSGRVVVTTRRRDAALYGDRRQVVEVGLFCPAEAVAFLNHRLRRRVHQLDGCVELAEALGYLPLALAQAAAYIADHQNLTCRSYHARLADLRTALAQLLPDSGSLPDDHQATVAATWTLSVELADRLTPVGVARPLLGLAAVLDPNGIPDRLFASSAVLAHLDAATGQEIDPETAARAVSSLHRLSLITHNPDTPHQAVRIHALVQRVTYETFAMEEWVATTHAAADSLLEIWPDVDRDITLATILRTNTDTLRFTTGVRLWHPRVHGVLFRAGRSLGETGQVATAIKYFDLLATTTRDELGPDHPDTLTARDHLARWRGEAGDARGAASALEQLLADRLRVLGADHPDTLTARNHLARWRGEAGDARGAASAFEQLLADRLRVLGADHPHTLTTRYNLARWRGQAGDARGAASAFEQLLADRLRVLGADHPHTLATRNNLARWIGEAGDPAGAATAYGHLVPDYVRVFGPDHPQTLSTRDRHAIWRAEAGDPGGAVAAYEYLLADCVRVLGSDHPGTLNVRNNQARYRGEAGDPAGAVTAYEHLLVDYLRTFGPDHPETLITRDRLLRWQGETGDPAEVAVAYLRLLTDQVRILGPDHPRALATWHSIARWRGESGDPASAVAICVELFAEQLRILGPDHRDTIVTRTSLSRWQRAVET